MKWVLLTLANCESKIFSSSLSSQELKGCDVVPVWGFQPEQAEAEPEDGDAPVSDRVEQEGESHQESKEGNLKAS